MSTGRVTYTVRRRWIGTRIHLQGYGLQQGRTRCGQLQPRHGPPLRIVETEEAGVTCRMCLRCKDTDAGMRYTR